MATQNRKTPFQALLITLSLLLGVSMSAGVFKLDSGDRFLMKHETLKAIGYLQEYHYNRTPFQDLEAETLLRDFMESLDSHHLFLLKSDEEEIHARFASTLQSVYLQSGDLYPAFQIFEIYRERSLDRVDWVFKRLEKPFDFDSEETFTPDRADLDWPESEALADDLWERRLKFELLQELLNEETLERATDKVRRRYERMARYIREIEASNVQEMFLANYAEMYDPHSTYYSADSMEEFSIAMENSLVGIGALLRDEDGYCVIQELIPGGPAELSGRLHPGDKIVGVSQEGEEPVDVVDMKLRKVVKMIRGDKGTKVNLTIWPADASDPSERRVVTMVRDEVKLTEKLASAEIFDVPHGDSSLRIGVIELPSFYGSGGFDEEGSSTSRDVEELLEKLKKAEVEGIVLDLRRNGGGLLSEAIELTGLFIPRGPVVQVRDTIGRVRQDWDRNSKVVYDGPLVVLTSRHSASASEIVAGALQDHNRAVIVGDEATHGKGTVQAIFDFNRNNRFTDTEDFGAAKITIQKFYLPNGDSTQNKGVVADIPLPSINMHLPIGESDLPNALNWDAIEAIEWDGDDSLANKRGAVDAPLMSFLRTRSEARLAELDEFQYLKENIDWFRQRQEQKEFSLNLEQRKKQKQIDREFKAKMDDKLARLSRTLGYRANPILLELAQEKEDLHQEKLASTFEDRERYDENFYSQQTFYYRSEEGTGIEEIRVDRFDYEKGIRELEEVVSSLKPYAETGIEDQNVRDMLIELRGADRVSDFNLERIFDERFAETIDSEDRDEAIISFLLKMVELDPGVAADRPLLDIHLRESLRIVADWVETIEGDSGENQLAQAAPQKKELRAPAAVVAD